MEHPCSGTPRLHDQFDRNMSRQALRASGLIVAYHHLHSKDDAVTSYGEVGGARCGLLRWISIDADILKFMPTFVGVTADLVDTPSNGSKHVEIGCGAFRMLLIHDSDPDAVVPVSDYGKEAVKTNIAPLFVSEDEWRAQNPPQPPRPYIAVFFHSKGKTHSLPAALEIRFPRSDNQGYQVRAINLYERFTELREPAEVNRLYADLLARTSTATEVIEDRSHPKIRKQQREQA